MIHMTPVYPEYWIVENHRDAERRRWARFRQREPGSADDGRGQVADIERLVMRIVAPLDTARRHGRTTDQVGEIVAAWAGPLARRVSSVECRVSRAGRKRMLYIGVANSAVAMELRPRLQSLLSLLSAAGIEEVALR